MNKLDQIEKFAREHMGAEPAHDFEHAHRVRNWAVKIASHENYDHANLVQATALLHDIGLAHTRNNRRLHGEVGAQMAYEFLKRGTLFPTDAIEQITHAIRYHCTNRGGSGKLLDILRDADIIDSLGAIGVIRTVRYWLAKRDYDPDNVRSRTWQMTANDFDELFDKGLPLGDNVVDFMNFQISCYDNMATNTGKAIARPLVTFTQDYILQMEDEVNCAVAGVFVETSAKVVCPLLPRG
jgi:uncharacterized protein